MKDIFVGTSGWCYKEWNPAKSLEWYVENSRLNAIELNASYYRLPNPSQIENWLQKGASLRWSVKVHRAITHFHRFNQTAWESWKSFEALFKPLDSLIDFYLFQLPPSFEINNRNKLEDFFERSGLKHRFALEGRSEAWFSEEHEDWARQKGLTLVSVDAPDLPRRILRSNDTVYFRLHGREKWYFYEYERKELREIADAVQSADADKIYFFANNAEFMLHDAQAFSTLLKAKHFGSAGSSPKWSDAYSGKSYTGGGA